MTTKGTFIWDPATETLVLVAPPAPPAPPLETPTAPVLHTGVYL